MEAAVEYKENYGEESEEEQAGTPSNELMMTSGEAARVLTRAEAGQCLHALGKCDTGYGYAYLGLDASDKNLTDISVIPSFEHVLYVNVSGNRLTSDALRILETMTNLLMLRADGNRLISAELKPMPYLQVLTLNKNNLTDTSGIHHKLLECLELNHNDIRTITLDPAVLKNLKTLELRENKLTTTKGIYCPSLIRLFLAENQIDRIESLEVLVNLKTLHLRSNKLANLDGFHEQCHLLSYVNLRNNKISKISELRKLSCLSNLQTLVILENPFLEENEKEEKEKKYRRIILAMLPKLKKINKNPVLDQERDEARKLFREMTKSGSSFMDFDLRD